MSSRSFREIRSQRGFTLTELMITVTVLAVLISLAAPSLATLVAGNRLATETNELMGALNLARAEAIRRGQGVTVLASTSTNYAQGWSVFPDANMDGAPASTPTATDGTTLRQVAAFKGSSTIKRVTRSGSSAPFTYTASTASDKAYVTFNSRGGITATGAAFFRICDPSQTSVKGRVIQINLVGKVSLDSTTEACP